MPLNTGFIFSGVAVPKLVEKYSWWEKGAPETEEELLEVTFDDAKEMIRQVHESKKTVPVPMKSNHSRHLSSAGIIDNCTIDGDAWRFDFKPDVSMSANMHELNVLLGVTNSVSLHAKIPTRAEREAANRPGASEFEKAAGKPLILEISLCPRGRRPGAVLDTIKDTNYKPIASLQPVIPHAIRDLQSFKMATQEPMQTNPVPEDIGTVDMSSDTFANVLNNVFQGNGIPTKSEREIAKQGFAKLAADNLMLKKRMEELSKIEQAHLAEQAEKEKKFRMESVDSAVNLLKSTGAPDLDENKKKICNDYVNGTLGIDVFQREVMIPNCAVAASYINSLNAAPGAAAPIETPPLFMGPTADIERATYNHNMMVNHMKAGVAASYGRYNPYAKPAHDLSKYSKQEQIQIKLGVPDYARRILNTDTTAEEKIMKALHR